MSERLVGCLHSRHWRLREFALQTVVCRLSSFEAADDATRPGLRAACERVLVIGLADPVLQVVLAALSLLSKVVALLGPRTPVQQQQQQQSSASGGWLDAPFSRVFALCARLLGHRKPLVREAAALSLQTLLRSRCVEAETAAAIACDTAQSSWGPPRVAFARLCLLHFALRQLPLPPAAREAGVEMVSRGVQSPVRPVRLTAIRVYALLRSHYGAALDAALLRLAPRVMELLRGASS
jgi:hypothetical protein